MQAYVLGFMFDSQEEKVLMIEKKRPEWQAGNLNGIGGKVEAGESPEKALVREFLEETGLQTDTSDWIYYGRMLGKGFEVALFKCYNDALYGADSMTDENVVVVEIDELKERVRIDNIDALIQLAMIGDNVIGEIRYL
jgi:8-oxo-dGTP diphosphatase